MRDLTQTELYSRPVTFMGAPYAENPAGAAAAILGMPFDCGIHPFRIGSRQGPQAIRDQSRLVRPYNPERADFDPTTTLNLVDCGDVRLVPSRIEEAFARIEEATRRLLEAGAVPVTLGGDGSVSLPQMRALAARHPGLVALHIDSHTDAYPYEPERPYNAATQFTHAAEEGLVEVTATYHLGVRGTTFRKGAYDHTRGLGYRILPMSEVVARGLPDVLAEIRPVLEGRPVYLCFDMDVFDPSCAPGVASPSWGGFSAREGIALLQGLEGLNIVAVDVNTVSPPHDLGGMTAFLAAQVVYECLVLLCRRPTT